MNTAVPRRATLVGLAVAATLAGLGILAAPAAAATLGLEATDAIVGQPIEATAELGESPGATGTIHFEVFGPGDDDCTGPALTPAPSSATVDGEGEYTSGTFTPSAAGTYKWSAQYLDESPAVVAEADCAALSTVAKASPSLSGSASSATVGGAIRDEATLTGGFEPSAEVSFSVFAPADSDCETPLRTDSAPLGGDGKATAADFVAEQVGGFRWTASYPGDANNESAATACNAANQSSVVGKASPGLAATATAGATVGQTIGDSAVLSAGFEPTGSLVFKAFGPSDAGCSESAAYEATVPVDGNATYAPAGFAPPPGTYLWTVAYSGDANNEAVVTVCGAANQSSTVSKALPGLSGLATSTQVGQAITDQATIAGGFEPTGNLTFRAFGPGDPSCAGTAAYEASVPVDGNGAYAPAGFSPPLGLYQWTVEYSGDANNAAANLPCGTPSQASAVGLITASLSAIRAVNTTVGGAAQATATLGGGAIPSGQLTFRAFGPADPSCSAGALFTWTVAVAGNGTYSSASFSPTQAGAYRWTVSYSGDANHSPLDAGCGAAASLVAKATPTLVGKVGKRLTVGRSFRDFVVLSGAHAPGGTITFSIYAPGDARCAKPAFVNTVPVTGNGVYRSDPFLANRSGTYRFVASYSGDGANQAASEACGAPEQLARVGKRTPRLKPLALLLDARQISVRARLAGTVSPAGKIVFRLFAPGDRRCKGRPVFAGSRRISANGTYALAEYIATKPGVYRLAVGYSGDSRNSRARIGCAGAQAIAIR